MPNRQEQVKKLQEEAARKRAAESAKKRGKTAATTAKNPTKAAPKKAAVVPALGQGLLSRAPNALNSEFALNPFSPEGLSPARTAAYYERYPMEQNTYLQGILGDNYGEAAAPIPAPPAFGGPPGYFEALINNLFGKEFQNNPFAGNQFGDAASVASNPFDSYNPFDFYQAPKPQNLFNELPFADYTSGSSSPMSTSSMGSIPSYLQPQNMPGAGNYQRMNSPQMNGVPRGSMPFSPPGSPYSGRSRGSSLDADLENLRRNG